MFENTDESPVLIAHEGPLSGQRIPLNKSIVFGRDSTCEVVIPDRQVSRFHARISINPEGIVLEDLGSKNGTFYSNSRMNAPMVLKDGDIFQIAAVQEFMFLTSDATAPLSEPMVRQGRLMLDMRSRRVWVNNQQLLPPLSALQFHLLWILYEKQGQVIMRSDLVSTVWGDEQASGVSDQALDALLRRLRDRLASLDSSHSYINTVRGHGVRLDNPPME